MAATGIVVLSMVIAVEEITDNRAMIAAAASGGVRDLTALSGHTIYVSPI